MPEERILAQSVLADAEIPVHNIKVEHEVLRNNLAQAVLLPIQGGRNTWRDKHIPPCGQLDYRKQFSHLDGTI